MDQESAVSGEAGRPASGWRRRAVLGFGVAFVTVLVWAVLFLSGASPGLSMFVAALLSGVTAALASQPLTPAVAATPVEPALSTESLRRLRHDLRGILSPALMTADRLLMTTQDPIAKRAAETMVQTVDRAEKRLAG